MELKTSFGRALKAAVARVDGWTNVLTGLGQTGRDKRLGTRMNIDLVDRQQLEDIWRGDDMAARIIETLPDEMLRQGYKVHVADDKDGSEQLCKRMAELCVDDKMQEALEYERAYGGSAILVGANDGTTDLSLPLREDSLISLDWLTVLAAYELHPVQWYSDPQAPKFGEATVFQLHPDMPGVSADGVNRSYVRVHESRMILFPGVKVSRRQMRQNNGWGDSVLVRCNRILSDYHQSWASAAILLQDFAQAVLKIPGLADLISTNEDEVVIKHAQLLALTRSTAGMYIIDKDADFSRSPTPMTGMPDMLAQFGLRMAAAADMPVSLLMGQAPAGMNATGASDIRFFYDRVKARQNKRLAPRLERFIKLLMLTRGSATNATVPDNWSLEFNPLWQLDELQEADRRLKVAQKDEIEIRSMVVSPEEVAASRYGGDRYSAETTIDIEARANPTKPEPKPPQPKPFGGA